MLVPTTHQAALLLLVLSFVCLGSWANAYKASGKHSGNKWRFELFYFDFAGGALLLALVAAFTLGTLGSELSFNDRIAVAGLRSQAFAMAAGFIFNIGNMLLVAAFSLTGIAAAFPLSLALAFLVSALFEGHGQSMTSFSIGSVLLVAAAVAAASALIVRSAAKPGSTKQVIQGRRNRAIKGIAAATIGGLVMGLAAPLAGNSFWGDLGLGAYAGLLMFCIGLSISTVILNLFFMNIGIEGGRVTFASYFGGSLRQHTFGLAGGMLWAGGLLASLLAQSVPGTEQAGYRYLTIFTQGSALLVLVWGLFAWGEFSRSSKPAKRWMAMAAVSFGAGLLLLAFRFHPGV